MYQAELRDPATDSWRTLASATVPRLYHSAAVLLPDGRVLTTGGNNYPTPEAFSPPYLFKGARPPMSAAELGNSGWRSWARGAPQVLWHAFAFACWFEAEHGGGEGSLRELLDAPNAPGR